MIEPTKIILGATYRDRLTGFEGTGCTRVSIQAPHLVDGKTVEITVDAPMLAYDEVLSLTGLPWLSPGMNRVYISSMIGGNGPEFLPRTTDRTGTLTYSRFELSPG